MEYGIIANIDSVNAATLKDFVIILLALGGFAMAAWTTFRPARPTAIAPDPLRIEKLDKFATRDFCEMKHVEIGRRLDGHDADVRAIYNEIKAGRSEMQNNVRVDIAGVHDRINIVLGEVRELKGRVEEKL